MDVSVRKARSSPARSVGAPCAGSTTSTGSRSSRTPLALKSGPAKAGPDFVVLRRPPAAYVPATLVVAVELLLSWFGSSSFPLTVAVLLSVPGVVVVTTIVTLALAPFARLPRLQVTVPSLGGDFDVERVQLPWVEETELKWTVAGKGSVTVTPVAGCGPLFVTVSV